MAARYLAEVRRVQPEGPYLLVGWSMGGVVAFEMAQQLRRDGQEVALLALIDTAALESPAPLLDSAALACLFASDLAGQAGIELFLDPKELRSLPPEDLLATVLDRARAAGALPPEVDAGSMTRWLALFESNYLAMLAYAPEPYAGRLALVNARGGQGAAHFWAGLAAEGADILTLEGDHFNLLTAPRVESLSGFLQDLMAAVAAERDEVTT
jgi:thioesterase domain-containing protein